MTIAIKRDAPKGKSATEAARQDVLTGGIVFAATLMFVGTGTKALTSVIDTMSGLGGGDDNIITITVLLNIALILFGWRRYVDLKREVNDRAAAEERANALAMRDPLTGFHNRRAMAEAGAQLLSTAQRRGKAMAMIMLDLDHFKNVNDVHGHSTGDALLRAVAAEISQLIPPNSIAARLGGDEFACCFLFDETNPELVDRVSEQIVSRLAQPFDADGIFAHISVSLGIAQRAVDCDTIDALMRRADIAMYSAKHSGRNRYAWFDASMEHELRERNELESCMRVGIPRGEFVPYFEQQVDITTGRLSGFEVLARWHHPTQGTIMPDKFITIAEETGMIADLSLSVIRQALEASRDWDPSLIISVNISPTQLKDQWLAQKIVKVLVETGFPGNRLEVEITESSLFENLSLAQSIVGSLKNQGIRLALDDFGTGYSSLAHLRALPFDRIKIDKSFVLSIVDNPESAAIVNAITRLGDSLGLQVTAEGIEDAVIEERLRQLGCHKGQGWHFGKPGSIAQTRLMLAERNLLPRVSEEQEIVAPVQEADDVVEQERRTA